MTGRIVVSAACFIVAGQAWGSGALAQAVPAAMPDTTVIEVRLRKDPGIAEGQVAILEGAVVAEGLRFRLSGLSVLQPVIASLLARDPKTDLRLSLLKPGRDSPSLSGSTRGEGFLSLSTRTQGGLDLLVESSDGPTPFALLVWVSDELTPPLADVIVRPDEYRAWAVRHPAQSGTPASVRGQPSQPSGAAGRSSSVRLIFAVFAVGGMLAALTLGILRRKHG